MTAYTHGLLVVHAYRSQVSLSDAHRDLFKPLLFDEQLA